MADVRAFGAKGDGKTDDTAAVRHALEAGDGTLQFPPGDYRLSETIEVALDRTGRFSLDGSGGAAKLRMAGPGPAFHLRGTHQGSADPSGFQPAVWDRQRMPMVRGIEIEGAHPQASGFRLEGTMQSTFEGVLLRQVVHAIHLVGRCRNLVVSGCHLYHNTGVGVFLDHVNLHQAIIVGSHISYCRQGGIRIVGSEIRNLQITGNDIEYNNFRVFGAEPEPVADLFIDCTDPRASVREGTITGNTIQATYSPGGANLRIIGQGPDANHKAGMLTITGNLIGSQETNVHLVACRGVVVTGNVLYSGHHRNLLLEGARNIVLGPNSIDHNPDYREGELCTGIRLADSHDITLSGTIVHDCQAGQHTVPKAVPVVRDGLVEIVRCRRVTLSGCEILDGFPYGIAIEDSSDVFIVGCTVLDSRTPPKTRAAVRWKGAGTGNGISASRIGAGTEGAFQIDPAAGVTLSGDLIRDT